MDEKMGLSHQIMLYNREKGNLTDVYKRQGVNSSAREFSDPIAI